MMHRNHRRRDDISGKLGAEPVESSLAQPSRLLTRFGGIKRNDSQLANVDAVLNETLNAQISVIGKVLRRWSRSS